MTPDTFVFPAGNKRLVLTAMDPRGLLYAATTLRQLLESKFRR